jgi:hypothetical protein
VSTGTGIIDSNGNRPSKHAHKLVAETAVEMAHELYDIMMLDNEWFRCWQQQNPGASRRELELRFVRKNLPKLIPQARAMLARSLATTTDPALRETIYSALLLDNTLLRGRQPRAQQN